MVEPGVALTPGTTPRQNLLCKIRELLWTLSKAELYALEKALCSVDEPINTVALEAPAVPDAYPMPDIDSFVADFYSRNPGCRRSVSRAACRETEARLRQFHLSSSGGGGRSCRRSRRRAAGHPPPARRTARGESAPPEGAPPPPPPPPETASRVGRLPVIACDFGSR